MLEPTELYEVDSDVPELDGAVLLHQLDGFVDAGSAGKLLSKHLLDSFDSRVIARFDVDALIDYRARRPPMTYETDHWADYAAPELVVHLLHDANETPFLLLTGPEPDVYWERFSIAVRSLIERWGVRLTVGLHGIPMGAPHTRPLLLSAHATRVDLVADFKSMHNEIQIPGSAAAMLEYRLGEVGHDAMGFAAHVPHYLAQSEYPAAALSLADAVADATGLALPVDALRDAGRRADVEIARQVEESDEVAGVVHALEEQYDAFTSASEKGSLLADVADHMPSGDELAGEFEQFLANQQGPDHK